MITRDARHRNLHHRYMLAHKLDKVRVAAEINIQANCLVARLEMMLVLCLLEFVVAPTNACRPPGFVHDLTTYFPR